MTRFHVMLPADVFPPVAGGAGWSSFALARALQRRGHRVTAIVPVRGAPGLRRRDEGGVPVVEVGYYAPRLPFVQNYYRFELLWPLLRSTIVAEAYRERELPLVIHGQHAQTIPAAVLAGRELGAPVAATIRDAWPWHYFATGLLGDRLPFRPGGPLVDWLDLVGRLGPLRGVLAAAAVPYLRAHVRRRAELLADADAVIACSHYMARRLAPLVPAERLHVVPNLVDIAATRAIAEREPGAENQEPGTKNQEPRTKNQEPRTKNHRSQIIEHRTQIIEHRIPDTEHRIQNTEQRAQNRVSGTCNAQRAARSSFLLYVGKLERNKGAHLLPATLASARAAGAELPPLVIAGNGELEGELRHELERHGLAYHFLGGWVDHDRVLQLMRRAEVLVFPSAWGEPLSRVLLEGCAVGACIAAIETGGTGDAIVDGVSGLLARDEDELGRQLARLLVDETLRRSLRAGAERIARERFAEDVVIAQIEEVYEMMNDE